MADEFLVVHGGREHNLKDVTVRLPRHKLICITGLSGFGTTSRNPRSTVGTVTEIYDYLRLLFARVGRPHCPVCGRPIAGQSIEQIVDQVLRLPDGTKFTVNGPVVRDRKGEYKDIFEELRREGFTRVKVDGEQRLLEDE